MNTQQDISQESTQLVFQEQHATELSLRDWEVFANMLHNPKPANEALKTAAKRYEMHIKHSEGLS